MSPSGGCEGGANTIKSWFDPKEQSKRLLVNGIKQFPLEIQFICVCSVIPHEHWSGDQLYNSLHMFTETTG